MPILNLQLSGAADTALAGRAAAALAALTADILGKDAALTAVAVQFVPAAQWWVGGAALAAQQRSSFFLEVLITDETNTAQQKADYIAAVFAAMQQMLGALHPVSYVHLHDCRAAAWGYGGLTQQHRGQLRPR